MRALLLALVFGSLFVSTPAPAAWQPIAHNPFVNGSSSWTSTVYLTEFSQNHPEWGHVVFFQSNTRTMTLGAKGCAVFTAHILARLSGGYAGTIHEFTQELRARNGYDNNGQLRWDVPGEFTPLQYDRRPRTFQGPAAYQYALQEVQGGSRVMLRLRTTWTKEHWIAGILAVNNDLVMIDPAGGRIGLFSGLYTPLNVTGVTVVREPPFPRQQPSIRIAWAN